MKPALLIGRFKFWHKERYEEWDKLDAEQLGIVWEWRSELQNG